MGEKSKILIIGGTGNLGKFIVEASIQAGHPTFVLVREALFSNTENDKSTLLQTFINHGVHLLQGDIYEHNELVKAIKQVDVVISVVGGKLIGDEVNIIAAIKEAGNVKRFIPSYWGNGGTRIEGAVEPAATFFEIKDKNRRAIEAEEIPHTYIACKCFAGYFVASLGQLNATAPPKDKIVIFGDGNIKAIFNDERDIATYTIKSVDDPRTLNKMLNIRPPPNVLSLNELVSLWEKKIGKTLEKIHIPEDQLVQRIRESPFPDNLHLSIGHAIFIKGIMTNFKDNPSLDIDATELYPEVKYTTMDEYLDQFV